MRTKTKTLPTPVGKIPPKADVPRGTLIEIAARAAEYARLDLDSEQEDQLDRYAEWLLNEAIPAGGLGPREGPRIWDRHVADSLLFASAWTAAFPFTEDPGPIYEMACHEGNYSMPLILNGARAQERADRDTSR